MNTIPCRGGISPLFRKGLESKYSTLIEFISQDPALDVQLRDNYIDVYFDGGTILKIAPRSLSIDEWYFYNETRHKYKKTYIKEVAAGKLRKPDPKTKLYPTDKQECKKIIENIKEERDTLLSLIKDKEDYKDYFRQAKEIVAAWTEKNGRLERKNQHIIACSNKNFGLYNNLVVIDIEYAVSTKKPYNTCKNKKVPKFDIIAVSRSGQLYAIELKNTIHADNDKSSQSVKAHKEDFHHTIGSNSPQNDFVQEMDKVLKTKQRMGLLPPSLHIDTSIMPKFAVAYSGNNKDDKEEFETKHHNEITIKIIKREDKLYLNLPE